MSTVACNCFRRRRRAMVVAYPVSAWRMMSWSVVANALGEDTAINQHLAAIAASLKEIQPREKRDS